MSTACVCVFSTKYSSKDATVKLWDLDTQHCFKTLVGHSREVRYLQWMCEQFNIFSYFALYLFYASACNKLIILFKLLIGWLGGWWCLTRD